ncbi:hypothetical protein CWI38_0076p0090 [Hamiltosporidium tvaerminnensis]|uniref:Uncharacterized protein n=1 Tax=Hamiltosporidium tvaerminnensis TaxID=1176355 RepID=A0A4Q9M4D4_9MICR|nr:hypothetical protein CWI38_0076p0090 [Hamiltosporidium tvaerminnensis]
MTWDGILTKYHKINIPIKTGYRDEDGELTININKESNLEEETMTVKEIEGNL